MPIYRDGNAYSDRGGGVDITDAIDRLIPRKRGKGRLSDPPTRDALPSLQAIAYPDGGRSLSAGAANRTAYTLTSSDGLFQLQGYTDDVGTFYVTES